MKRLVLGCAIALPLTLACDPRPSTEPTIERGADAAELGEMPQAIAALDEAEKPLAPEHECDGDCKGKGAPAHASNPAGATRIAAATLAKVERSDRPVRGGEDARVEIMVFSDFECPFCAKLLPSLEEALETYGDDVSITFKQMPLPFHPSADPAARASLAANEQGKFWEMHDALFANPTQVRTGDFDSLAAEIDLDIAKFQRDMNDPALAERVLRDTEDARVLGIRGTPSMVIGDKLVVGAQPLPQILAAIDAELAEG